MIKAKNLAKSGLLEFLCRPPQESERDAALHAAASACLSAPGAQRAWAKLEARSAEAAHDHGAPRYPYGVEVPIDLAGRICGTVGVETEYPVNGQAHERAAAVAELLATWEARRRLWEAEEHHTIVGCSAEIRHVELLARRYAALDEPVLIQGETGVGKELVAQTLHCVSKRSSKSLCTINCAAVPDELIASELFGHRRGAFTGAVRDQRGRFEMAEGATLFLDEIGEMGPGLQASLLRVLEYGEIQQLGDEGRMRRINVRVIAASNRDLAAEVAAGRFRSDLYYRLTPLTIDVPPLRERPEDIPVLARYFVSQLEDRWKQSLELVSKAMNGLIGYPFPGNVRELRNLVLRAAATSCEGRIDAIPVPDSSRPFAEGASSRTLSGRAVPAGVRRSDVGGNGHARVAGKGPKGSGAGKTKSNGNGHARAAGNGKGRAQLPDAVVAALAGTAAAKNHLSLDTATAAHLRRVLTLAGGNVSRAARMLDIPRTTLQSKLRRYGVH